MRKRIFLAAGLLLLVSIAAMNLTVFANEHIEVVKAFEESANHLPEGIALDKEGNIFVGLGPPFFVGGGYGEVRQISSDGTEMVLVEFPEGSPVAGLTVDSSGGVYFALTNPGQPDIGVYRVTDDGAEQLPGTENMAVPNGFLLITRVISMPVIRSWADLAHVA